MAKLEEAVASSIGADGALTGIPGFANGYVVVGGSTIALRADRPPILMRSGVIDLTSGSQSGVAELFLPFKTLLIGLVGIITTAAGALDGNLKFGTSASATAYLSRTLTAGVTAGTVVNFTTELTGYNATTGTGIAIAANTRLSFGTGTATTAGGISLTAILVPNI